MGIRKDTLFPNTDPPEMIRRRAEALEARPPPERLGQDWLITYHRERAELAEEYADWPEEWEQVYAQWQRESAEGWLTESPPALEEGDIPRNRCEGHCTPLTPTIGPCNRPF